MSKISQNNQSSVLGLKEQPQIINDPLNINNKSGMFFDSFYFFNTKLLKSGWLLTSSDTSLLLNISRKSQLFLQNFSIFENYKNNLNSSASLYSFFFNPSKVFSSEIYYSDVDTSSRFVKRSQGANSPIRVIKYPVVFSEATTIMNPKHPDLFKVSFNSGKSELKVKPLNDVFFYTIKQNKYKRRNSLPIYYKYERNFLNEKTNKIQYQGRVTLLNNSLFNDYLNNSEDLYNLMKKNKKNNESIPVTLARRMLRTKRTLVLPAHVNITLITNSFDVVHSWFIPGLGVKLDCVPGRSTHHTLYIDNVGFYYGQCAEICGRYHHHMPIRVCALPFEHFLLW